MCASECFSGLQVQSAIDNRVVDTHLLFRVAGGRALCTAARHVLQIASTTVTTSLNARSRRLYSGRIYRSMARLDVPTWDDPAVSSQINALQPRMPDRDSVAWAAIMTLVETGSAFLKMFSEAAVLIRVLREHGDGSSIVLVSVAGEAVSLCALMGGGSILGNGERNDLLCFSPMNQNFSLGRDHTR